MTKYLSEAAAFDFEELQAETREIAGCSCVQEAAQKFVEIVYGRFSESLVLLRLFITERYDRLPQDDRRFVDERGRVTNTGHLIHGATPIFTLLGTRGARLEWNDRRESQRFRCIPLASTSFVASLSMLSRQFESVGLGLDVIDEWEYRVTATGRADGYRGMLHIKDSAADRDLQGRLIVPMQDFVAENGVKTTLGFGSGYESFPALVTLFAFTNEYIAPAAVKPMATLLDLYISDTKELVKQGRVFS